MTTEETTQEETTEQEEILASDKTNSAEEVGMGEEQNFVSIVSATTPGDIEDEGQAIPLPPDTSEKMEPFIPTIDKGETLEEALSKMAEDEQDWSLSLSTAVNYDAAELSPSFNKGLWSESVGLDDEVAKISLGVPSSKKGKEVSVQVAVLVALAHISKGKRARVPLFHSGFSVVIDPIRDVEFIELYRKIYADKVSMGRYTYGMSFSNSNTYTIKRYMDLILKHISEHTLDLEGKKGDITQYITEPDIMLLEWGIAMGSNPGGVPYRRPCTGATHCNHVETGTLDLARTLKVDADALDDDLLRQLLVTEPNSLSTKEVMTYQDRLQKSNMSPTQVITHDGTETSVTFSVPSYKRKLEQGTRWIESLHERTVKALGKDDFDDERSSWMDDLALAGSLAEYAHWVTSIQWGDGNVYTGDHILPMLEALSSSDEFHEVFRKALKAYMAKQMVALIGIETYRCKQCDEANTSTETEDGSSYIKRIIPIQVHRYFFTILGLRVQHLSKERNLA